MHLMQLYRALEKSPNPVDDAGEPIDFHWDDDGDGGSALRINFENCDTILVFSTDRIIQEGNKITVTAGAKDYQFTV